MTHLTHEQHFWMTLARFSVGRVVLHLVAMLGDGAFRFHAAGILREFVDR